MNNSEQSGYTPRLSIEPAFASRDFQELWQLGYLKPTGHNLSLNTFTRLVFYKYCFKTIYFQDGFRVNFMNIKLICV